MFYILAIIGMIFWGVSPLFAKAGLQNTSPLVGLCIRTVLSSFVILTWLCLNGKISELKSVSMKSVFLLIIEALLATVLGDLAYFAALKKGSASIVMLIMACSPLITVLFSIIIFHEKLTIFNIIGAGLIMIGIYFIV